MRTANELMINMDNAMIEFQAGRMAIGEFREICRAMQIQINAARAQMDLSKARREIPNIPFLKS